MKHLRTTHYAIVTLILATMFAACTSSPSPSNLANASVQQPVDTTENDPSPTVPATTTPDDGTVVENPIANPVPQPTAEPSPDPWGNPRSRNFANLAKQEDALFTWINPENSGIWQYSQGSFVHPIALDVHENVAYLLDGGRVMAMNLIAPESPEVLLAPGDFVEDVPVVEPLDLAALEDGLLVLDRAGDLYRYDWRRSHWVLERYARPIGETSSHYFVALAGDGVRRVMLETSYNFGLTYQPDGAERLWLLPEVTRPIDTAVFDENNYVLVQPLGTQNGTLLRYTPDGVDESFVLAVELTQPRQIAATKTAVYVLDMAGRRLQQFDTKNGALQQLVQLPEYDPISSFWVDHLGEQVLLVGRDKLYWVDQPEQQALIDSDVVLENPPHDFQRLSTLPTFIKPVVGTNVGVRDLQMPGAPRHYRLGVHEGVDFYWGKGTPIRAAADGIVIRATLDYERPSEETFQEMREDVLENGVTAPEYLDFYRGCQVWIQHEDGSIARYVHMDSIDEAISEGVRVTSGQIIGTIGNTGSPASIKDEFEDAHLHFELWLDDHYVGQFLRPVETRELMLQLFGE